MILLQLPKPRWLERSLRAKALLLSTPPGLWGRRIALLAHLSFIIRCATLLGSRLGRWPPATALLRRLAVDARSPPTIQPLPGCFIPGCREVWRNLFAPGTFRGVLRNAWRTLTTGARFEWPSPGAAASAAPVVDAAAPPAAADSWYITAKDLAHFKWTIEEDGAPTGASPWEPMMEKQWPGCTYTAWRRTLPSGKSEYKSITVSGENAAWRCGGGRCRQRSMALRGWGMQAARHGAAGVWMQGRLQQPGMLLSSGLAAMPRKGGAVGGRRRSPPPP